MKISVLDSATLRKHVSAIHIAAADYGLMHKKSVNAAMFLAREDIKRTCKGDVGEYLVRSRGHEINHEVSLTEFKTLINYNSNDNEHLKSVLRRIATTPVEFDVLGPSANEDSWAIMPLLSMAKINGSVVSFRFPSEIREQLINPSVYAPISFAIQNQFNGEHAISLYENTFRYHRLGKTPWMKTLDFRRIVGATGSTYDEFKYLNREVIKKGIIEVNKVSNINLEVEFHKKGRFIDALRFTVKLKKTQDMFLSAEDNCPEDSALETNLQKFGLSKTQIAKMFDLYDISYLLLKIEFIETKIKTGGEIKNLAAFAWSAIVGDYKEDQKRPLDAKKTKVSSPKTPLVGTLEIDDNSKKLQEKYGKSIT